MNGAFSRCRWRKEYNVGQTIVFRGLPDCEAGTPENRPWLLALLWLVVLTPFFFLTYGFANTVTGQRSFVPSIVFGWERTVPFLAWTIVPY